MKRIELEKYLGHKVKVTMIPELNREVIAGELHKTGEDQFKDNPNLYLKKNYYFLSKPQSYLFRCSYVQKVRCKNEHD